MSRKRYCFLDFETEGIDPRPQYPPRPVGVALIEPGKKPRYYAWGHTCKNNCTRDDAARVLRGVWATRDLVIVAHNGKFDLEIAEEHFGLTFPHYEFWEDTMLLAFLHDPYNRDLELKSLAHKICGLEPEERDELKEWIVENIPEAKRKKSTWARYICKAPGDLVGRYAVGDVVRTQALFEHLLPMVLDDDMGAAYDREKKLTPILIRAERDGMPVDRERLKKDVGPEGTYPQHLAAADKWIFDYLGVGSFNVDSGDELAECIERGGFAPNGFLLTPTGKKSTAKESIEYAVVDLQLQAVLAYRQALATCIRTFLEPWLIMSEKDGVVHTQWRATAQDAGGGARTGRLSSSPNLQNIPTEFEKFQALFDEVDMHGAMGFPHLPSVRSYVVAGSRGMILCGRDYSSQELRVLAHYEDDVMAQRYREDPAADLHAFVSELVSEMGLPLDPDPKVGRKIAKTVNFLKVYGGGAATLAVKIRRTLDESRRILSIYEQVVPGLKELNRDIKARARMNQPIRTLGGRLYYCEPPRVVNGRYMTFDYKLLNYLIQGGSADQTKEAVIRFDEHPKRKDSKLLLTVHDEVLITAPKKAWKPEMLALKESMENAFKLEVPVLSEGEVGYRWTEMQPCE